MQIINRKTNPDFKKVTTIVLPEVDTIRLKNGIPVHIINGGTQDIIKMDVIIKAGGLYSKHKLESPLAALMLNEGTGQRSAHEIAEAFDYYGAYFNPMAEKDNAFASLLSLTKHYGNTLPVFTDALTNSTFPEKEFNTVISKRLNNFLIESEKTTFLAKELFFEQLFGAEHPYGRKSIKSHYLEFEREQLIDFYKSHYQAKNYSIVLSGKVSDKEIQLLDTNFGVLNGNQKIIDKSYPVNKNKTGLKVIEKSDAVQTSIRMGLITIDKTHEDYLGLKILSTIFGGYFGSRLMKNIREEKGFTYGIHSMLVSLLDAGYIAIAADVKLDKAKETIKEIEREIVKLQNSLVSNEELELVRNYMMGELLQTLDGPISCSEAFKAAVQFEMGFEYFDRLKNTILTITPQGLKQLANKYLRIEDMTIVVAGKY